ncbi:rhodanese-related sulfurtransferase [Paenibacillaceae bacterium]|nr:rhodanese-related sulfurtransferase [Paenibacillaceae bacterium]
MKTQPQPAYAVLLYYKFVKLQDAEQFAHEHLEYCKALGIKGRILIADEGINGTLSGTIEQTEQYIKTMHAIPEFKDMVFKIDEVEEHAFKKLFVRYKQELVTFRYDQPLDPNKLSGERLSPEKFHNFIQRDDVIILDGRNDYEYDIGHFRNAIRPDVESFREFPEWIRDNMQEHKDKPILTYCTGGIRCEKLSGFLLNEGFQEVYQLDGGIVTYGKDPVAQGKLFDGKCYVFDERISVPINQTEHVVVGKCFHCGTEAEYYRNCVNDLCHLQHIVCDECEQTHHGFCSSECSEEYSVTSQK